MKQKIEPESLNDYFTRIEEREPRRTIGRSFGEVGSGKTSFWLTGTAPILVQSFDKGVEGLYRQLCERLGVTEREIFIKAYKWAPGRDDFDQGYAQSVRAAFEVDFYKFLDLTKRGTVLWDKETDSWQMFRYAEFGAPNTEQRNDYAKLYARYAALIDDLKDTDLSFGAIQGMKDEWESYVNPKSGKRAGRSTGKRIPAGCDRLDEMVLTDLFHERIVSEEEGRASTFRIATGKVRQNSKMQDQTFENITIAEFGQLLIPGSEALEWL